jgi:hypothetical protein
MKVLISTHHFLGYTGTEIYTITLLKKLVENGHQVVFYSKYLSSLAKEIQNLPNLTIIDNLSSISYFTFDIIHTNHNINVIELRHYFPDIPLIFHSHGVKPFLEQPPIVFQNIDRYLAVSEFVKNNLIKKGIKPASISIVRNLVDPKLFYIIKSINERPKRALIFSNYNDSVKDTLIANACKNKNIKYDFLGGSYGQVKNENLNDIYNKYDLVFTSGRGAVESLLTGRATIIINSKKMDKMVTPLTFTKMIKNNLSGNYYHKKITQKRIENEIEKYNPNNCDNLINLTTKYYDANLNFNKLMEIYLDIMEKHKSKRFDQKLNDFLFDTINTTRYYGQLDYFQTRQELEIIKLSKLYKIYKKYTNFKNIIKSSSKKFYKITLEILPFL